MIAHDHHYLGLKVPQFFTGSGVSYTCIVLFCTGTYNDSKTKMWTVLWSSLLKTGLGEKVRDAYFHAYRSGQAFSIWEVNKSASSGGLLFSRSEWREGEWRMTWIKCFTLFLSRTLLIKLVRKQFSANTDLFLSGIMHGDVVRVIIVLAERSDLKSCLQCIPTWGMGTLYTKRGT